MMKGTSVGLYKKIIQKFSGIKLIASGGVSSVKDVEKLEQTGCRGVIIGKALYEEKISLLELKKYWL